MLGSDDKQQQTVTQSQSQDGSEEFSRTPADTEGCNNELLMAFLPNTAHTSAQGTGQIKTLCAPDSGGVQA